MSVPEELAYEQWRTYLPFLYKFYFEHKDLKLVETIGAKLYKDLTDPSIHLLSSKRHIHSASLSQACSQSSTTTKATNTVSQNG